jgi:DNA-directed RNA polymerase subunit RPC12/RpoP
MYTRSRDRGSCPGIASLLRPVPEYIECPNCGSDVEIWSDEEEVICSNCGAMVVRERRLSCLEWCRYADKCRELIEKARRGGDTGGI